MPKPVNVPFGPFTGGLNNALSPDYVAAGDAQDSVGVDTHSGILRGFYAPSDVDPNASVSSSSLWVYLRPDGVWMSSAQRQFVVQAGSTIYRTNRTSNAAATYPTTITGSTEVRLGYPEPSSPSVAEWGTGNVNGARSYRYTVQFGNGVESNPSPIVTVTVSNKQVAISSLPTGSNITGKRIWAADTPDGTFHLFGTVSAAGTSFNDNSASIDTSTSLLDWGPGGIPSNVALSSDHSEAPNLTALSDTMHSVTGGAGTAGSGILFGSVGSIVRWSALAFPDYWPTSNALDLSDTVEAMITLGAETLAFTKRGVFTFSGVDDSTVSASKTPATFGVRSGCGFTVKRTPVGILFLADQGLALFDGAIARIVSDETLSQTYLAGLVNPFAISVDSFYLLFHATGTLIVDLRAWPKLKVTTMSTPVIQAAHVTSVNLTRPTLYVIGAVDGGYMRRWTPLESLSFITPGGTVAAFVGDHSNQGLVDDKGSAARFYSPGGGCYASDGYLYVCDYGAHVIRRIDSAGNVVTVAGGTGSSDHGSTDGTGRGAKFYGPAGIVQGSDGALYITDYQNHTIRRMTLPGYVVTTFAGSAISSATTDGQGTAARFVSPAGITVDAIGNLYVADAGAHYIRKIDTAANVTTLAGTGSGTVFTGGATPYPQGVVFDPDGFLYVAAATLITGTSTGGILKIDLSDRSVSTVAGTVTSGDATGTGTAARMNTPWQLTRDSAGNLYVPDKDNNKVYKVTKSGVVTILLGPAAGTTTASYVNGSGTTARFHTPWGCFFDPSGNLFIADQANFEVRKVAASGSTSGGAPIPWSWTTGDQTCGDPSRRKRLRRLWVDKTGDTSVGVYADGVLVATLTASGRLPSGVFGYRFHIKASSVVGTGTLTSAILETEVQDGG